MSQKDFKTLKIKNKEIIVEASGSEYGSLGISAAKKIGKSAVDALKQVKNYIKTNWDLTFGYMWNLTKSIYRNGLTFAAFEQATNTFLENNRRNLDAMESINKAQPGASDASLFTGLTCPAAVGLTSIVDLVNKKASKSTYSRGRIGGGGSGGDNKEKENLKKEYAEMTYHNLIVAISHISHNLSPDALMQNANIKPDQKDFEYFKDEKARKFSKTRKFQEVCIKIKKILELSPDARKEKGVELESKPSIISSLDDLILGKKEKEVINNIVKRDSQRDINMFAVSLVSNQKNHESINNFKSESKTSFSTLKIKNNDIEILNEKIFGRSKNKNLSEDEFFKYADSFEINRHKQAMSYSLITCMSSSNFVKSIELNNMLINSFYKSIQDESKDILEAINKVNNFLESVDGDNQKIKTFIKKNKIKVPLVNTKSLYDFKEKLGKDYQNISVKIGNESDDNQKELQKASSLLLLIEDLGDLSKVGVDICDPYIKNAVEVKNQADSLIKQNKDLFGLYQDVFDSLNVNKDDYLKNTAALMTDMKKSYENAKTLKNNIDEFTKGKEKIESKIKALQDNENNSESSKEKESDSNVSVSTGKE